METFLHLPQEKRRTILDAAMTAFAKAGYKKTSMNDIAVEAGISKAAVFHYFGSKRALYQYLLQYGGTLVAEEFHSRLDDASTDFFDRVLNSARVKADFMRAHPPVLAFLSSVYFEAAPEVADAVRDIRKQGGDVRQRLAMEGADLRKFKEDVDPQLVLNILVRLSEGYASPGNTGGDWDIDAVMDEFEASLRLMKRHFYKEEYLV